ncbi:alpha/beta hydrolase-fold protein [Polaribacter gochangensis]|uniref:alpha/beta hydrolase-fold protein n=1 Tax=Polaribacter gochangensis TaxID=3252903 RepID=UPI003904B534
MRKILPLIFLFIFSISAVGQKLVTKKYESEELQDIRTLQIHLPKGYERDTISNYPLTIVLDSEYLFDLYVGNSQLFSHTDKAPKQIVVGIEMANTRLRDASFDGTRNSALTADSRSFIKFIKEEVLPYIEGNYKTSPFLTIVGNGITANLITHFLKDETPIFNAYVCLNPTFSPDISIQMESYDLDKLSSIDNTYYFYYNDGTFISNEKQQRIGLLKAYLNSLSIKNFNVKYDFIDNSPSNVSAIGEGISRAFDKIFEIYSGINKEEFETKIKNLSPLDAITYLENKYIEIDYLFGSNLGIREIDIIAIESIIIEKENGDYLKDYGEMILNLYPFSPLGHYYLGRYYEAGQNYSKALEQYRLGYGKMDPADPNADKFYQNVQRMLRKG